MSLVVGELLLLLQWEWLHVPAFYPDAVDEFDWAFDYVLGFAVALGGRLLFDFDDPVSGEISFLQISRKADIRILPPQFAATDWSLWIGSEGKHYRSVFVVVSVTAASVKVDAASTRVVVLSEKDGVTSE